METYAPSFKRIDVPSFKSYYVVWKRRDIVNKLCKRKSLNRTMQYGNQQPNEHVTAIKLFKSYYVVWKLQNIVFKFLDFFCLNRTMQYGNQNNTFRFQRENSSLNRTMQYGNLFVLLMKRKNKYMFKSYYVVWKREQFENSEPSCIRLNRTMQYGNIDTSTQGYFRTSCLNRTMQYGNLDQRRVSQKMHYRLNRTMQYGNSLAHQLSNISKFGFKSYYVVWKLGEGTPIKFKQKQV